MSPGPTRSPDALTPATASPAAPFVHPAVDSSRPFGAHLRMSWWKPLVLVVALPLVLLALQLLTFLLVGVVEGSDDPLSPELTPLKTLAVNLATAATGLTAVLLLVGMTRVPWRALLSWQRAFDRRRLARSRVDRAAPCGQQRLQRGSLGPGLGAASPGPQSAGSGQLLGPGRCRQQRVDKSRQGHHASQTRSRTRCCRYQLITTEPA